MPPRHSLKTRFNFWQITALIIASLVVIPVVVLLSSVLNPEQEILRHLAKTVLAELVLNTLWLSIGVLVCTALLGVSLGWLTGACSFPGRKIFSWALILPMAVPAYVLAFIFVGVMDFAGPLQTAMRLIPGFERTIVEVRSTPFVVLVLSLTLYPYVYILSRTAFLSQGKGLLEAARTLGVGPWRGFFTVTLPMARPWIVSALALVLMETLADFGAVSIFNFDTFTTAIYKSWFGLFSLHAAAQLSSVLVVVALLLIMVEAQYRSRMRFHALGKNVVVHNRIKLRGKKAWAATIYCTGVVAISFILPVVQLVIWSIDSIKAYAFTTYAALAGKTFILGITAAIITCAAALLLSYAKRCSPSRLNTILCKISTMGYALPGTVLAVGVFIPGAWLDTVVQDLAFKLFSFESGPIIQGTLLVMLLAYMVRFMAAGFGSIDSAMLGITPNLDAAAALSGVKGAALIRRIHLPLLRKGLLTAFILVTVDVIKEMPITLMMRPFGWDTLAVKIYELTSEGEWERAAFPALLLIAVSIIPVILLTKHSEK